jgi:hypothetical protein
MRRNSDLNVVLCGRLGGAGGEEAKVEGRALEETPTRRRLTAGRGEENERGVMQF